MGNFQSSVDLFLNQNPNYLIPILKAISVYAWLQLPNFEHYLDVNLSESIIRLGQGSSLEDVLAAFISIVDDDVDEGFYLNFPAYREEI